MDNRSFFRQKLDGLRHRARSARLEARRRKGIASYSLNDLDLKLDAILEQRDGFYIEAGANDGLNQSNTVFFERHRGWTGLLVEPLPRQSGALPVEPAPISGRTVRVGVV